MKNLKLKSNVTGVASLPAILLFGGIIIELGLASALLVYYMNNTLYGTRLSSEALVAAQAGIDDAMLRVITNKNCPDASCPASYTITSGSRTADVTICRDCIVAGKTQITSTGQALTKKHQLTATLTVSTSTGQVTLDSLVETPL